MALDTQHFKGKLEAEYKRLEEELSTLGVKNPKLDGDWFAKPDVGDVASADDNELADKLDHYQENTELLNQLEIQYNDVKHALERIEKGTYGKCETCEAEIEHDRLEANPPARTCKAHMNG
jgi:RNA polymerase-binding transcription factor DksA